MVHVSINGSSPDSASTLATTTSEHVRMADNELARLRQAVQQQRAVATSRPGRKKWTPSLSDDEAQLRILELKHDIKAAAAELPQRSNVDLFKSACSTDLLFLIDTTGSMGPHIDAAKNQMKSIVDNIEEAFLSEAEVRIAVVGYKDHMDKPSIQFLDFTSDTDTVRQFIDSLNAIGGADLPEDVLGGVRQALDASWQLQNRCVIHIADAPGHGRHLNSMSKGDDYPSPGSEPHKLTYEPLLKEMIQLNINYALLRINDTTDLMSFAFLKMYNQANADCKLHVSNRHYTQAYNLTVGGRGRFRRGNSISGGLKGGLLFEEMALGTTYTSLRHLVVRMVTSSASRTAVRVSTSSSRSNMSELEKKGGMMNLAAIGEDEEDDIDSTKLENGPPKWDKRGWLNESLIVEGFCPDVSIHDSSTLDGMMASDDNIKMNIMELNVQKRARPFAQGAMRVAHYARTASSTNRFVVKSYKKDGKRLPHLAEDMRCQALCKAFALEFNALAGETHSLDFITTTCLKGKTEKASEDEFMSLEPFIDGTYVKYNNNCGYVNEDILSTDKFCQAAQAFAHFTFERSQGRFLVSDLQGVGGLLTDPAIHAVDPERFVLADTNLGSEGFKFFFATHVCNGICTKLGLKSTSAMVKSGVYQFRDTWPSMDNTVCCSSKLCGRIVRLSSAKKSATYPGCHWCNECWPQLNSTLRTICMGPRGPHEFKVSPFYYESQGRAVPRSCREHQEHEDEEKPRTEVVSRGLWQRLKGATKRRTMSITASSSRSISSRDSS